MAIDPVMMQSLMAQLMQGGANSPLIQALIGAIGSGAMGGNAFTGNQGGYMQSNMSTPSIGFTGVQSPYQWTSNPLLNMAPSLIAGAMGLPYSYVAQLGQGASPLEVGMMGMSRNSYMNQYQSTLTNSAGELGTGFGRMLVHAGMGGDSPQSQRDVIGASRAFSQSGVGQAAMQFASSSGLLTPLLGGDPIRAQNQIFAERMMLVGRNEHGLVTGLVDGEGNLNASRFAEIGARSQMFAQGLQSAISEFDPVTGKRTNIYNPLVTRGFAHEDIARYIGYMTSRGFKDFQKPMAEAAAETIGTEAELASRDPEVAEKMQARRDARDRRLGEKMTAPVKALTETLSAVGDVLGLGTSSADMVKIVDTIDKLSGGKYANLDANTITTKFKPAVQRMAAMAAALGVSADAFMEISEVSYTSDQQGTGRALGIGARGLMTPAGRAYMSMTATASQQASAVADNATFKAGLALVTGDTSPENQLNLNAWYDLAHERSLRSNFGVLASRIQLAHQQGQIAPETYEAYQAAVKSGNADAMSKATRDAASQLGTSVSGILADMSNVNYRKANELQMDADTRQRRDEDLAQAMVSEVEVVQRPQILASATFKRLQGIARERGVVFNPIAHPELATKQVEGILKEVGENTLQGKALKEVWENPNDRHNTAAFYRAISDPMFSQDPEVMRRINLGKTYGTINAAMDIFDKDPAGEKSLLSKTVNDNIGHREVKELERAGVSRKEKADLARAIATGDVEKAGTLSKSILSKMSASTNLHDTAVMIQHTADTLIERQKKFTVAGRELEEAEAAKGGMSESARDEFLIKNGIDPHYYKAAKDLLGYSDKPGRRSEILAAAKDMQTAIVKSDAQTAGLRESTLARTNRWLQDQPREDGTRITLPEIFGIKLESEAGKALLRLRPSEIFKNDEDALVKNSGLKEGGAEQVEFRKVIHQLKTTEAMIKRIVAADGPLAAGWGGDTPLGKAVIFMQSADTPINLTEALGYAASGAVGKALDAVSPESINRDIKELVKEAKLKDSAEEKEFEKQILAARSRMKSNPDDSLHKWSRQKPVLDDTVSSLVGADLGTALGTALHKIHATDLVKSDKELIDAAQLTSEDDRTRMGVALVQAREVRKQAEEKKQAEAQKAADVVQPVPQAATGPTPGAAGATLARRRGAALGTDYDLKEAQNDPWAYRTGRSFSLGVADPKLTEELKSATQKASGGAPGGAGAKGGGAALAAGTKDHPLYVAIVQGSEARYSEQLHMSTNLGPRVG